MRSSRAVAALAVACLLPYAAHGEDESGVDSGVPRFLLHGFSDVTLRVSDKPDPSHSAFELGQFDLFFVSNLAPDISFLAESVYELDDQNEQSVDVERVLLQYTHWEKAHIVCGRVHTALGYWNTFYHHGKWLQPNIDRPAALRFEDDGGILPVHSVGAEVQGQASHDAWTLGYVTGVANGRGAHSDIVQGNGDVDRNKAFSARVTLLHSGDRELELGFSGYHDVIPPDVVTGRSSSLTEAIGGAHVRWDTRHALLLGEAWAVRHHDRDTGAQFTHHAGYALGYIKTGAVKPYAGADILDLDVRDDFYTPIQPLRTYFVGLRYDIGFFDALKFELRRESQPGQVTHVFAAQTAFTF